MIPSISAIPFFGGFPGQCRNLIALIGQQIQPCRKVALQIDKPFDRYTMFPRCSPERKKALLGWEWAQTSSGG